MVFAIELVLTFANANRRDTVLAALETRLAQLERFGVEEISTSVAEGIPNSLVLMVRFVSEAERDAFWNELDGRLGTGGQGPVTGSRGRLHDCTHDEQPPQPCVIEAERVW